MATDTDTKIEKPAGNVGGESSALTPGEQAYLDSGGKDDAALITENEKKPDAEAKPAADAPKPDASSDAKPAAALKPDAATATPTPAVAAEPAPEPGEEEISAPDGKTKRRVVDSRALKDERTKRHAVEAELAKERETRARIDERLKLLSEAVSTPAETEQPKPQEIPDPEKDIFGYATYLGKQVEELKGSLGQVREQTAEERAQIRTISTYQADAAQFASRTPDFRDAYNHIFGLRKQQLELQGYAPQEVAHWLYTEEMNLVDRAMKGGKSPAQLIYDLSKSMGYAPKAPAAETPALTPPAQVTNGAGTNGHAAPAAPALPLTPPETPVASVTDEVIRIRNGQGAAKSLSSGGGGGTTELTLETILAIPEEEFKKMYADPVKKEQLEKVLRGG